MASFALRATAAGALLATTACQLTCSRCAAFPAGVGPHTVRTATVGNGLAAPPGVAAHGGVFISLPTSSLYATKQFNVYRSGFQLSWRRFEVPELDKLPLTHA